MGRQAFAWAVKVAELLRRKSMELRSTITCPECGVSREETMPEDACVFFYICTGCGTRLRPNPGDCCVFCSYGSVPCPPIQRGDRCGPDVATA